MLLDSLSLEVRPALWAAEEPVVYGLPSDVDWGPALDRALTGYERLIADDGYAVGEFSIADCAIAGRMQYIGRLPIDLGRYPRLRPRAAADVRPPGVSGGGLIRRRG